MRANRSQRRSMTLICRTAVLCRSPLNQQEPLAAAGVLFRRNRVPRHACGFDTLCLTVTLRLRQRHSLFPWRPSKEPVMRTADYTAIYAVPRNFLRAPPPPSTEVRVCCWISVHASLLYVCMFWHVAMVAQDTPQPVAELYTKLQIMTNVTRFNSSHKSRKVRFQNRSL